jgi:putative ABC transport system permease protein
MVSIARKTLFHDRVPFAVAQAGIIFSVGLVSIQVGLFFGFTRSTSTIIDHAEADIWVVSKTMQQLDVTLPIPYQRFLDAMQVDGVNRAEPFIFQEVTWQQSTHPIAPVTVIGIEPESQLFRLAPITQERLNPLSTPYTALLNRSDLEPLNITTDIASLDTLATLNTLPVKIVGVTQGLRSMVSSPFLFTAVDSSYAYVSHTPGDFSAPPMFPAPLQPTHQITAVLVRAQPGQNLQDLKARLGLALPDTRAYTQKEFSQLTQTYWLNNTGVTFILGMGAVVAIVVGTVVVSQVLYMGVVRHLGEYATLKAMGASNGVLYRIVLEQALWMALLGYFPGLGLCAALGAWTAQTQAIQIIITPPIALGVLGLTLGMGATSAVVALQKVANLDPALVFQP